MVDVNIMMDTAAWDRCLEANNYYLQSSYKWSIRYAEIFHDNIKYTSEQTELLKKSRSRSTNPFFFLWNNKIPMSKTKVVDNQYKTHKIDEKFLTLNRLNNFEDWECNVGKDWLDIKADGSIEGICGNMLYNQSIKYNLYDLNFIEKFQPIITKTICHTSRCWCDFEANMPKRKIFNKK